jgi:hypothetical protein
MAWPLSETHHGAEVAAGRGAGNNDPVGGAAVLFDIPENPCGCGGGVFDVGGGLDLRIETVINGYDGKTPIHQFAGDIAAAVLEPTGMEPDHRGKIPYPLGTVDIQPALPEPVFIPGRSGYIGDIPVGTIGDPGGVIRISGRYRTDQAGGDCDPEHFHGDSSLSSII